MAGKLRAGWASHQVLVVLQDSLLVASLLQHNLYIVAEGSKRMVIIIFKLIIFN